MMTIRLPTVLASAALAVVLTANIAQAAPVAECTRASHGHINTSEPYGYFYAPIGSTPKGLADLDNFLLRDTIGGTVSGLVILSKDDKTASNSYAFATGCLDDARLVFTTEERGGIRYHFSGQFLAAPPFTAQAKNRVPVLRGTLTKHVAGKNAAEMTAGFAPNIGGEGE